MRKTPIYLDYNATAPIRHDVKQATIEALANGGNASSVHSFGRTARASVEKARSPIAALVGASTPMVTFTSGASEANLLALRGLSTRRVFVSQIEHDSVRNAITGAQTIPVDSRGLVAIDALPSDLGEGDLVSVMWVNNETGVIQDIASLSAKIRTTGAWFHVDGVQAAGRLPISFADIDALSLSAHKIGGPPGIGALIARESLPLTGQMPAGGQERGRRGGTENVPAIAGFGIAAQQALEELSTLPEKLFRLRHKMEETIKSEIPEAYILSEDAERVSNTSCIALPNVDSAKQVMALDLAGFAVSAGSACSSGKVKASPVAIAMGLAPELAAGSLRISFGWNTIAEQVEAFTDSYITMAKKHLMKNNEG